MHFWIFQKLFFILQNLLRTNNTMKKIKDKDKLLVGNWTWIDCMDGYCVFAPPRKINKKQVKPQTITNPCFNKAMNKDIDKNIRKLPKFWWYLNDNGKAIILTEKVVIEALLKFTRQNPSKQKGMVTEEAALNLQNPLSQPQENDVDISVFSIKHVLDWDDVKFGMYCLTFIPNFDGRLGSHKIVPLVINNAKCRVSFNHLKLAFKRRLPKITYRITKDFKIRLDNEPLLEAVIMDFSNEEVRTTKYRSGFSPVRLSWSRASSMVFSPEYFKKYDSKYINFLVEHQMDEFGIVPVSENMAHSYESHFEEAFIFTINSSKYRRCRIAVLENIHPSHATILFLIPIERYDSALRVVFDYFQSDTVNKRSAIHDGRIKELHDAGVICCNPINHDEDVYDWKRRLNRYIR